MSFRTVLITQRSKLDLKMNYMAVRQNESVQKIFLDEVSTIIVEDTSVSLTVALLCELMKKKIKVIFCDEKRNPSSELIPYYGSHDTSAKIRNQISWDDYTKKMIWTEIVTEKIRKQKEHLELHGRPEASLLDEYIRGISFGDATNREGHAAKVYFNAIFGLDFTRSAICNTNSALDYGYSIILSAFTREIVSNGYITKLGLSHDNMFNKFNLASDLMEPFRVVVDKKVLSMKLQTFEHEEKIQLVNILNDEVIIDEKTQYVNNAIHIYCKSVFDAINERDISLLRFYRNEL